VKPRRVVYVAKDILRCQKLFLSVVISTPLSVVSGDV